MCFILFPLHCLSLCLILRFTIIIESRNRRSKEKKQRYCDINFSLFLLSLWVRVQIERKRKVSYRNGMLGMCWRHLNFFFSSIHKQFLHKGNKLYPRSRVDSFSGELIYSKYQTRRVSQILKMREQQSKVTQKGKERERNNCSYLVSQLMLLYDKNMIMLSKIFWH